MKLRNGERIQNLNVETGSLIDLSTSGVALLLSSTKVKDQEVTIFLNEKRLKAKVIYSLPKDGKFRIGVQFQNVSSEEHVSLQELIDKFSKGIPIKCVLEEK